MQLHDGPLAAVQMGIPQMRPWSLQYFLGLVTPSSHPRSITIGTSIAVQLHKYISSILLYTYLEDLV